MKRDERDQCHARRTGPSFFGGIRPLNFGAPTVGPVSFQERQVDQRMLEALISKGHTEFRLTSSALNLYKLNPKRTALLAR